jgi:hypothetical protein
MTLTLAMGKRRSSVWAALLLLLLVLLPIAVKADPHETIIYNGSSQNRVDIAVLGDGYTANELQKYKDDVQQFIQGFFAEEPFREYQRYFNVHRIDVISNQSGADHPERGVFVNTAFDATYNCQGIQRLVCVNVTEVNNVVANSLGPAEHDMVLVIVNDSEYGGSGGSVAVASTNAAGVELVLHEEGHSFGFLGDEYGGPPPPNCDTTFEPFQPNLTKQNQHSSIKWNKWIDASTPIPTTSTAPGVPGLYEGAGYCDFGLYRPTYSSKMRFLGVPYDQVNSEQLIKRTYDFVSPLDSSAPAANNIALSQGQTQAFSVSTPVPFTHALLINWWVDGQQQATGSTFNLNSTNLSVGNHSVTVLVADPTAAVRNDPNELLTEQRDWDVTVGASQTLQLSAPTFTVNEGTSTLNVQVTRSGDTTSASSVDYATSDTALANACSTVNGVASSRCDYLTTLGTLQFAAGETTRTISIPIIDDVYADGSENFTLTLANPAGAILGAPATATLTITDNDSANGTSNPIDVASFFVRQHYVDFLNREPDPSGLNFWTNEITQCGANAQCLEIKRINVSAAFFLSIEFQETGYLVYRTYKSGFGNLAGAPVAVRFNEFLRDTQQIGQGVQVGVGNWQAQLEANKQAYVLAFVQWPEFLAAFPGSLTADQFVTQLNTNAGGVLSATEKANLTAVLGGTPGDATKRASVLRSVAEDSDLKNAELNKAFVLMQYFGYLRRNPNDAPNTDFSGYTFWLDKLNEFGGNFVNAEMVKAFIVSGEYRLRFGP